MNKKITLCLLSLFFNTSFTCSEQSCVDEVVLVSENDLLKINDVQSYQKFDSDAYRRKLILGSVCNILYVSRAWYLVALYLQKTKNINKVVDENSMSYDYVKKPKNKVCDSFLEGLLFISQSNMLHPTGPEAEKIKGRLYKFWLTTYVLLNTTYFSKIGYDLHHWMFPSAAKIASAQAKANRIRNDLESRWASRIATCLKMNDSSEEIVAICNRTFDNYLALFGADAFNRIKKSIG